MQEHQGLLVLSRHEGQSIVIPQVGLRIVSVEHCDYRMRIGFGAPRELQIFRQEIWNRIVDQNKDLATILIGQYLDSDTTNEGNLTR